MGEYMKGCRDVLHTSQKWEQDCKMILHATMELVPLGENCTQQVNEFPYYKWVSCTTNTRILLGLNFVIHNNNVINYFLAFLFTINTITAVIISNIDKL